MMGNVEDLTKKFAANMAAMFGVRSDAYSPATDPPPTLRINPKKRKTLPNIGDNGGAVAEWKKRGGGNKKNYVDGSSGSAAKKKKKKRNRTYKY